jgi:hypothetical protein
LASLLFWQNASGASAGTVESASTLDGNTMTLAAPDGTGDRVLFVLVDATTIYSFEYAPTGTLTVLIRAIAR